MNPIKNLKEKCSCELDFIKYTLTLINNKRKKIIKYLKCIGKLYDSYAVGLNTAVFCKVNKYNKLTLYKKIYIQPENIMRVKLSVFLDYYLRWIKVKVD